MSESFEEVSEERDMSEGVSEERDLYGFNCGVPCPPPLRHQRSTSMRFEDPDSPPMYRSLAQGSSSAMLDDGYDDVPVYRSISGLACLEVATHAVSDHALEEDVSCRGYAGCGHAGSWGQLGASSSADYPEAHAYRGLSALLSSTHVEACAPTLPPPGFVFELPAELLDEVLSLLAPCPDLFAAMRCSRSWCEAARVNYHHRRRIVLPTPDALLRAAGCASPGDTIVVAAGFHVLSTELSVDKPLRLLGSHGGHGGTPVLTSTQHVLLRTRCSAHVEGLTLLRLGNEVGYPNCVVYAEAGTLTMCDCRISCGGAAPSAAHAMQVFEHAPPAGQPWLGVQRPSVPTTEGIAAGTAQDPQSGLWVGAAARVRLSNSLVLGCQGPGIKIYRGELEAEGNTVAFASRGANVVVNGGKVTLRGNEIKGALGDGVSSWNNSHLSLEANRIHANSGAGIAINTGGGAVSITRNLVFDNCCSAILFATSQTKPATLSDNDLEGNVAGGVQGLHQVAGQRFQHQQRRRSGGAQHLQRAAFSPPPPLLPQPAQSHVSHGTASSSPALMQPAEEIGGETSMEF